LWNAETQAQVGTLRIGSNNDNAIISGLRLTFSPDGKIVATTHDRTLQLWDVQTQRQIGEPLGLTGDVTGMAFGPDGKTIATASIDGTVRLWDVSTRRQLGEPFTGHTDGVGKVVFQSRWHHAGHRRR
jgi:WD40 repeat protein